MKKILLTEILPVSIGALLITVFIANNDPEVIVTVPWFLRNWICGTILGWVISMAAMRIRPTLSKLLLKLKKGC